MEAKESKNQKTNKKKYSSPLNAPFQKRIKCFLKRTPDNLKIKLEIEREKNETNY